MRNGNKRKNGFSLENNLISDELSDFIGHERGKPISRSEVTRRLTAYVKKNELQDQDDKRFVNLDTEAGQKLKDLLSDIVDKEGNPCRLTIITINKFVNKHYVGKVEPAKETSTTSEESSSDAKEEAPPTEEKMAAKKECTSEEDEEAYQKEAYRRISNSPVGDLLEAAQNMFYQRALDELPEPRALSLSYKYVNWVKYGCGYGPESMKLIRKYIL